MDTNSVSDNKKNRHKHVLAVAEEKRRADYKVIALL